MKKLLSVIVLSALFLSCEDASDSQEGVNFEKSTIVVSQTKYEEVWASIQTETPISDDFILKDLRLVGTQLEIEVDYSGGCENHAFQLIWPEVITMIYPPRFTVILVHDDGGDLCEAFLSETLTFELDDNQLNINPDDFSIMDLTILNGSNPNEEIKLNP